MTPSDVYTHKHINIQTKSSECLFIKKITSNINNRKKKKENETVSLTIINLIAIISLHAVFGGEI